PVPAANDGGSSTAALLELSRVLDLIDDNPDLMVDREVWLVFFDAEDQGNGAMSGFDWIEGSRRFVAALDDFKEDNQEIEMMILLDMIGDDDLVINWEYYSDQDLLKDYFTMGRSLGYSSAFPRNQIGWHIIDDHKPFVDVGIPAIDIIDMEYLEWHTTADDLDHVSKDSIGAVGRVTEAFLISHLLNSSGLIIENNETGQSFNTSEELDSSRVYYYLCIPVVAGIICFVILYFHVRKRGKRKMGDSIKRER
ncbi:MAG: M28 family metallopeptidase, partial [Promethearchaeota archaeon]